MSAFEDSGKTTQLAVEGGQWIAHTLLDRPARLLSRLVARLRGESA